MTLRIPAKVLLHVWSNDFYDMTFSTGKQRRHMINVIINGTKYKIYHRNLMLANLFHVNNNFQRSPCQCSYQRRTVTSGKRYVAYNNGVDN